MKFSEADMAYEAPAEVDFTSGLVLRGAEQWKRFLSFKRGWAKLDPKLRTAFPTDEMVNKALRKWLEAESMTKRKEKNHG